MEIGRCSMRSEDAPPEFWQRPDERAVIEGALLESRVPTRFFQTIDALPAEWGRLSWRVQLNRFVSGDAGLPVFRTFYPGVEWNLNRSEDRWFLSAWFRWHDGGPRYRAPDLPGAVRIDGDTVLFRITWLPKPAPCGVPDAPQEPDLGRPLFLRSRVDGRDRKRIAQAVQSRDERPATADPSVISLDDLIDTAG